MFVNKQRENGHDVYNGDDVEKWHIQVGED